MKLLSNSNTKLMKDGILSFSIPAYKTRNEFTTCPGAKDCISGCYARQGFFLAPWVRDAKERNFKATFQKDFVPRMVAEVVKRKPKYVRIHDAGDFYSWNYFAEWLLIANTVTPTTFYAYTKMVPFVRKAQKEGLIPINMKLILSYGGKWDALIDPERDRHAVVFGGHAGRKKAGYADATVSDLVALREMKIGLVYHGAKSLFWSKEAE